LRFMANKWPAEDHWYPKDPLKKLKVDMYLGIENNETNKQINKQTNK